MILARGAAKPLSDPGTAASGSDVPTTDIYSPTPATPPSKAALSHPARPLSPSPSTLALRSIHQLARLFELVYDTIHTIITLVAAVATCFGPSVPDPELNLRISHRYST